MPAPSRLLRSATAVALAGCATTLAYVGSAAPAQAAGYNGYCKDASGVTVVVDFGAIGKGIAIRCAPGVGGGATDLDAVQAAGIPIQWMQRQPGFLCRLYGEPAASRTLPGGGHEGCVRPGNTFWSVWQAANGGKWAFASAGVSEQTVTAGGFVGFRFSSTATSAPAPGVAPKRPGAASPAPKPSSTAKPAPKTTAPGATRPAATNPPAGSPDGSKTTAPQAGSSGKGSAARSAAGSAGAAAGKSSAAPGSAGASATGSASSGARPSASSSASAKSSSSASPSSSSSAAAGASATGSDGAVAAGGPAIGDSDKMIDDAKKDKSSGLNATTLIGGGVLAALAVGGAAVAIVRRRTSG
ncbi:hypothetical protein [Flexivirga meconopsidis]|uniref:hypothetical protein n=1 Tax=Flexivirga meconopsidis TaxID=2977121 RepID=UPI0022401E55|nr:hypothetical protein [Flexivirga meconopsidis]